jgi:hypothetical protein
MKLRLTLFLILIPGPAILFGQSIELRPYAGYTFQETFPIRSGDVRIKAGGTYGITASYILKEIMDINLTYQWQSGKMDLLTINENDRDVSVTVSYIQLGFNRNFPVNDKLVPYTGLRLGLCILTDHSDRYENATKFGIGLNAGLKYYLAEKVGVQIYGLLESPIQGAGVFMGIGTGGVSSGVSTYTYIMQASLGGGVVFKLK